MGTIYSAITAEMQEREENIRLVLIGGGLPDISDNFSMGGTYSRFFSGPDNPGSMPTPASDEFTCGQWIKSQGPFSDEKTIELARVVLKNFRLVANREAASFDLIKENEA